MCPLTISLHCGNEVSVQEQVHIGEVGRGSSVNHHLIQHLKYTKGFYVWFDNPIISILFYLLMRGVWFFLNICLISPFSWWRTQQKYLTVLGLFYFYNLNECKQSHGMLGSTKEPKQYWKTNTNSSIELWQTNLHGRIFYSFTVQSNTGK